MSDAKYERLIDAGAPRLPDEHFYRVSVRSRLGVIEVVGQVRRRIWLGWVPGYAPWTRRVGVTYCLMLDSDQLSTADKTAAYVCRRAVEESRLLDESAVLVRELRKLTGDHP